MQFGKVDNPESIDFTLPPDQIGTAEVLRKGGFSGQTSFYIGCAKWNRQDLKNFYPRGTKDELVYYSSQFNSIEMNASFYRLFPPEQFVKWRDKVPTEFKFFPKIYQGISHWSRLKNASRDVESYVHGIEHLEGKLGMVFLQMINNFSPKPENRKVLESFLVDWPKHIPLAVELRHTDWYNDFEVAETIYQLFEEHKVSNIITDTAGRRDLLHMRLTNNSAFIRYVGANHPYDYSRIEDWVMRLKKWVEQGIENIYFFVHQNNEVESVNISAHLIKLLNQELGLTLKPPKTLDSAGPTLFE